jgi:hypothetical protein
MVLVEGGKEGGRRGGLIPGLTSGRGGVRMQGDESGRRRSREHGGAALGAQRGS